MELNEKLIKFRGKVAAEKTFLLGDEVELKIKGEVIKVERENNHDGTYDEIYVIKLLEPILKDEE